MVVQDMPVFAEKLMSFCTPVARANASYLDRERDRERGGGEGDDCLCLVEGGPTGLDAATAGW